MRSMLPTTRYAQVLACVLAVAMGCGSPTAAEEPPPPQIADLYLTDEVTEPITLPDGRTAVYVRSWVDADTRTTRKALWRCDDGGPPRPLEAGEPDAFRPRLSPDGRWILFHSTRPFPDGRRAFEPVPSYSDTAADLWLIPIDGGRAIPLGGPGKPYGRVITDRFYGRVCFAPGGKRMAFVADEGIDPRTDAERNNGVIVVRDDQGEGYEGYGPTQVWVADLLDAPTDRVAARIRRVTDGRFWYGDPQWAPDGSFLVVHANRTEDQESARYSVNRNFDLWKIGLDDLRLEQLTTGPGPQFSPRIAPDGRRLVCLSSPRRGPHYDVFNLLVVDLGPEHAARVLYDHHASDAMPPPSLAPSSPLPDGCWRDERHVVYSALDRMETVTQCVDVDGGPEAIADPAPPTPRRSPLLPPANPAIGPRLHAADEIVRWKSSDGLEIEGVVTLPPPSVAKPPHKLLLLPHGGPHHRTTGGSGFDVQIFATRGYAVFQPNFRGSTGYGRRFLDADRLDLGGGDMQDIITGIDMLVARGLVDRDRQFVYGTSYGGYMATWLVGHTDRFRAAVAENAVTDLDVMWHLSDLQSWTEWEMGGRPWDVADRMRAHSPLAHAENVRTPTLILHSLNDRRCPVAMGRMFHRRLRARGVPTEMVIYPDEGHGIRQLPHREDVLQRILAWFEKHDVPRGESAE
jgi:dipeptidyl aminopeptidase/acylaminoacyl peptidase